MEVVGEDGDGEEAVKQCIKLHSDVVVMDIVMPNIDGSEVTKQIKAKYPDTAILM